MKVTEYIKDRIFKGSAGLSQGIFVMLGIGLLLKNLGILFEIKSMTYIGTVTTQLVSPAIGVGIAFALGGNLLTILSSMTAATIGASALTVTPLGVTIVSGEPVGATLAAIVATFVGKRISGKTPVDMMLIPLFAIFCGGMAGVFISKFTGPLLIDVGRIITNATQSNAIVASVIIAMTWGIFVISPASSVMMALALNLNPMASAAALIGCSAHFMAFSVMSYKQASPGALIAIFLCTPKVQLPNITRNPILLIPPTIAAAIVSPIAVNMLGLTANKEIAGMGMSSFVAPLNLFIDGGIQKLGVFIIANILCAIISFFVFVSLKKIGKIVPSDLKM
ncbi:MAG: PTS transporter subunit IIC [Brevinema sp.]